MRILAAVVTHDDFNIEQWQLVDMNNDDAVDLMYQGDDNSVWYYEANWQRHFRNWRTSHKLWRRLSRGERGLRRSQWRQSWRYNIPR